jgi:hypothetical protein
MKATQHTPPDTKKYLHDLIEHYEYLLNLDQKNPLVETFKIFIQEEKYKCLHQLRKVKEAEVEGMIMANASVCPFHSMNFT